jgi:hypothetical protein
VSAEPNQAAAANVATEVLYAVVTGLRLWRFPVETTIDINPNRGSIRVTCRGGKSFADLIAGEIIFNPPVNHRYDKDGRAISEFEVMFGQIEEAPK